MEVKKKGNYQYPYWDMEVLCDGNGWEQKHKPCFSTLKVEDGDIVKRITKNDKFAYGCICPECKCFTEIPDDKIPVEVKKYCLQVAEKNSCDYNRLSEEEKKLSENL